MRNWRRLLAGALAAVLVLGVAFSLLGGRVNKTIEQHPEIAAHLETDLFRERALEYVYVTGNVPTLSQLMDDPAAPRTHGAMTLLPGVKIVNATGLGGEPPEEVGAFYPIPFSTFNNYSWLGTFYLDFGLIGCLLLPLLFGALFTYVARRAGRAPTFLGAWMLSLALYVVAFSPLLNKLSTTLTWQYALLGPVLSPILMRGDPFSRYRGWLRDHRRAILAAAAGTIVLLVPVATLATDDDGAAETGAAIEARLERRRRSRGGDPHDPIRIPENVALASRLRVADPGMRYQGLYEFLALPNSTRRDQRPHEDEGRRLAAGDARSTGTVRGMHVVLRGPWRGRYPLGEETTNLLDNGDLSRR